VYKVPERRREASMAIILNPEQERIVEAQIVSGRFHTIDEVLDQVFSVLQDSSARGSVHETQREAILAAKESAGNDGGREQPFWERITERMKRLPPEVFDGLPRDGASEHDHYLYGSPKRNQ
jgi:Arc/MetJ-type ribon-helix-helix transcriptional regulator